jgi:hypothetical protein
MKQPLTIIGAILLCTSMFVSTFFPTPVRAAGWGWFLEHRPPTHQCSSPEWIISRYEQCGGRMANGERMNCSSHTAAHNNLPFGTQVNITNPRNHKTIRITITDRGPIIAGSKRNDALDLSPSAFNALGPLGPDGRVESGWGCISIAFQPDPNGNPTRKLRHRTRAASK